MDACPGFRSTSAFIGCAYFPLSKLLSQRVLIHLSEMDFSVPIDQTVREARKHISGERASAKPPAGRPDPG